MIISFQSTCGNWTVLGNRKDTRSLVTLRSIDVDLKLHLITYTRAYTYIAALAIYPLQWVNEVGNQFDRSVKVNDCRVWLAVDPATIRSHRLCISQQSASFDICCVAMSWRYKILINKTMQIYCNQTTRFFRYIIIRNLDIIIYSTKKIETSIISPCRIKIWIFLISAIVFNEFYYNAV